MLTEKQASDLINAGTRKAGPHFFRMWMPYLFQRIEHAGKKHAYLPLNRDYKPLGCTRGEHVDYDAMALSHGVAFSRDPATFEGIWSTVRDGQLWLYSDSPRSRYDYFARLEKLMAKSMPLIGLRT